MLWKPKHLLLSYLLSLQQGCLKIKSNFRKRHKTLSSRNKEGKRKKKGEKKSG
jgi:hypothetical protein